MNSIRIALLVVVVACTVGVTTPQAAAATFVVNKTSDTLDGSCTAQDCSLREAIGQSNATTAPDVIVLPSGQYKLALGTLFINEPVTISGGGAGTTDVVGPSDERVLNVTTPGEVTLSAFTIRGGHSELRAFPQNRGGGIRSQADLTLIVMRVHDNSADFGGGIFNDGGTLNVISSTISENVATGDGGGLYNRASPMATMTIDLSTLSGNRATSTFSGGAIYSESNTSLLIARSTITENAASRGGGIRNRGTLSLASSLFSHNTVVSTPSVLFGGGGIDNDGTATIASSSFLENGPIGTSEASGGAINNSGAADVTTSTLADNQASQGGALANSGTLNVQTSTVSGNLAGIAAIRNFGGSTTLTTSTITANHVDNATWPAGIYSDTGTTTIRSSIVSGNEVSDCIGGVSAGHNVVGISCPSDGTNDSTADPTLGPLADNGGPNQTHAILPGSAAVNRAGGDTACNGATSDQRGVPRPDNACDSGAYELTLCRGVFVNVVGTNRNDSLAGTPGPDGILALGGKDRANGGDGNDALCGGTGADKLSGGAGNDTFDGGPGTDTCKGNAGNDKFKSCETQKQ